MTRGGDLPFHQLISSNHCALWVYIQYWSMFGWIEPDDLNAMIPGQFKILMVITESLLWDPKSTGGHSNYNKRVNTLCPHTKLKNTKLWTKVR